MSSSPINIAIIDMYDGTTNLGMDCIENILKDWSSLNNIPIKYEIFALRNECRIPNHTFDIYLSSGGPGSPNDSEGEKWDQLYTSWLQEMLDLNKPVLLICHSFQMACRHFNLGKVCLRKSKQLGVLPVHPLVEDPIFNNLNDPFYALDSRVYQIIEPNDENIALLGAEIIALEKHRPHVPLERAIMAIKFSNKMYGVQFHPEGETNILLQFFMEDQMKNTIIEEFGIEKWEVIINKLNDPHKVTKTYENFIPNFLKRAIEKDSD